MVQRIAILVIGLVAVYVVFFSAGEEKDMMEETTSVPQTIVEEPSVQSSPTMDKDQETGKLLAELRTIPVSEFAANLSRYQRLLELHPGDETFIRKVAFYSEKLRTKQFAEY